MALDALTDQLLRSSATSGSRIEDRLQTLERRYLKQLGAPDLAGLVNAAGAVVLGESFNCARIGTGLYRLNFTRPFLPYPVVVAMVAGTANAVVVKQEDGAAPTSTTFTLRALNGASAPIDSAFWFVARQA